MGPAIRRWLMAVGELEALSALAGYAYEHPADPFPELIEGAAYSLAVQASPSSTSERMRGG